MRRRIQLIQMLIQTGRLAAQPETLVIVGEYQEVVNVNNLMPIRRRCLIQVLHSTRALDTTLGTFLRVRQIPIAANRRSLGAYLHQLERHNVVGVGNISNGERQRYQQQIVQIRNRYMHEAGANPAGNHAVNVLLNEMHACLLRVLTL